jgi:hypothetical protein
MVTHPPARWAALWCLAASVVFCLLAGCGGKQGYELVPVSGRVTLRGEPLANARVNFQPTGERATPPPGSTGVTDASGRYVLSVTDSSGDEGAVAGAHIVTIATLAHEQADDDAAPAADRTLPPKAGNGTLTFEVPSQGTDSADFEL